MASKAESPRIVFVSDVHLRYEDEPYLRQFLDFLEERAKGARELWIHGDLFDFYIGPRQGELAFYAPLFESLSALVRAGTKVVALHGNRDYLIGKCFRRAGVEVIPDEVVMELGGRSAHLSHGDQFCIEDRSYQFWARGVLRAWPFRVLMSSLPSFLGVRLARTYRRISGRKVQRMGERRPTGRLPTILGGVRQMLAERPHDLVLCGHIHWLAETPLEVEGHSSLLVTTGAWEEVPNCLEWDGQSLRILVRHELEGWRVFDEARDRAEAPLGAAPKGVD